MRKIVLLAAASIMFVATQPVSAKVYQPCLLKQYDLWKKAKLICIAVFKANVGQLAVPPGDLAGAQVFALNWVEKVKNASRNEALQLIAYGEQNDPWGNDCNVALLAAINACGPKSDTKRKYSPPIHIPPRGQPVPTFTKRSVPSGGLLEATPGLSPQGPAAGGTPSRKGTVGAVGN
jgi:hypothetical protein